MKKHKTIPQKKPNIADALKRRKLFLALEDLKHIKTSYESGPKFIEKIRKEWMLGI